MSEARAGRPDNAIGLAALAVMLLCCGAPGVAPARGERPATDDSSGAVFHWSFDYFSDATKKQFDAGRLPMPVNCMIALATRNPRHPALRWKELPLEPAAHEVLLAIGPARAICAFPTTASLVVTHAARRGADTVVRIESRTASVEFAPQRADAPAHPSPAAPLRGSYAARGVEFDEGTAFAIPAPASTGHVLLEFDEAAPYGGASTVVTGQIGVDER